jgi:nitrogen fixation protein NifQ
MARAFPNIETSGDFSPAALASVVGASSGATAYRVLTGIFPEAAEIDRDEDFDRHVLASILAVASTEGGALSAQSGLSESELSGLLSQCFVGRALNPRGEGSANPYDKDEMEMVRELLLVNRSSDGDTGAWLASMVARRAMEPNHLWEDLGLRDRSELTRLISRHFAPLALRNDKNMRWKRFIYRMMCEDDGFVMCSTPVCSNCADYELCYGVETGNSRIASAEEAGTKPATRAV